MGTPSHFPVSLPSFAELLLSVGSPSVHPHSLPSVPSFDATSPTRKITQGRRKKQNNVRAQGENYGHATTISMLPDDVLLEIFDIFENDDDSEIPDFVVSNWHILVHVCRRWRQIVLASPRRLDLLIGCTFGVPVRKNLDIWPAFPIFIHYGDHDISSNDEDNAIAALEHPNRVRHLGLNVTGLQLKKMATVMEEPFPVLRNVRIVSWNPQVLPTKFLGGSAPCLGEIYLYGISFPALPTLLLSTSDLVELHLSNISPTGYISPEAMIVGLAALPKLKTLFIGFQSATPRPHRIRPPPVTRTVLPALDSFRLKCASEYMEDLVARLDAPELRKIHITYLNQLVDFQVAQLSKFIDRSVGPKLTLFRHLDVTFDSDWVTFTTHCHANYQYSDPHSATITIFCEGIDWQVSHIAQVLSQISATLSNVVHLKLSANTNIMEDRQLEGTDVEWVQLLHQFSTVQTMHVSRDLAGHVALALEAMPGEMVAEVLPSLDLMYVEGLPASTVEKFVAARRFSDRHVTAVDTESEFDETLKSYVIE